MLAYLLTYLLSLLFQIIKHSSVVCVTVSHLSYASRLLSAILVATFTVERFIGVVYPLRRSSLLSIAHARRVIGTEAFVCAVLATFTTFTIGIDTSQKQKLGFNDTDCDILTGMTQVYAGFNVAFLIVGSIIAPVLIVVALNAAILTRIVGRSRLNLHGSDSSAHDAVPRVRLERQRRRATDELSAAPHGAQAAPLPTSRRTPLRVQRDASVTRCLYVVCRTQRTLLRLLVPVVPQSQLEC